MAHKLLANLVDILQCNVCMEEFQASGTMKPKVLPCQHSFCMGCLSRLADGVRIECPLCRKICQNRVDELPNNFILLQLIDSGGPSPPMATSPSASPSFQVPVDRVVTIQKYLREPAKLLPELKLYSQGPKPTEFKAEHLSVILQCLEQYVQSPLQQPDILIVCMEILEYMMKFGESMSDNVKERVYKSTMLVVMSRNVRSAVQSLCINILLHILVNSEFEKNCTCACMNVLFGLLDEPIQPQEQFKLVIVLFVLIDSLQRAEKEDIGSRLNIKRLLGIIESNWSVNEYLKLLLGTLGNLTDLTTTPCTSIVEEGGLDLLERMLKDGSHSEDVLHGAFLLVSNISEVPGLKKDIIKEKVLMETVVTGLQSKDTATSVLSAGTIAHLALVQASEWLQLSGTGDTRKKALTNLHKQVLAWIEKDPGTLPFGESSFKPLFPILQMYSAPPCQLYAAWYLQKLCNENKKRYHEMLIKDDGLPILLDIKENVYAYNTLRKVVSDILASISSN